MKKMTEKTIKTHETIKAYIDEICARENYELKTYENIANCVTIKYNKHVVTDVYYTTSGIRMSTKSMFFTSDDLSKKENVAKLCETFDDCNIIKNVTDFQIRTSKKSDLTTVINKSKSFYDAKQKEKNKKNAKKKDTQNDTSNTDTQNDTQKESENV